MSGACVVPFPIQPRQRSQSLLFALSVMDKIGYQFGQCEDPFIEVSRILRDGGRAGFNMEEVSVRELLDERKAVLGWDVPEQRGGTATAEVIEFPQDCRLEPLRTSAAEWLYFTSWAEWFQGKRSRKLSREEANEIGARSRTGPRIRRRELLDIERATDYLAAAEAIRQTPERRRQAREFCEAVGKVLSRQASEDFFARMGSWIARDHIPPDGAA